MNDGQYTNIRNYLEELASQNKQLIAEQKRTNELLNDIRLATNRTDGRAKEIAEQIAQEQGVDVSGVAVASGDDGISVFATKPKASAKKAK